MSIEDIYDQSVTGDETFVHRNDASQSSGLSPFERDLRKTCMTIQGIVRAVEEADEMDLQELQEAAGDMKDKMASIADDTGTTSAETVFAAWRMLLGLPDPQHPDLTLGELIGAEKATEELTPFERDARIVGATVAAAYENTAEAANRSIAEMLRNAEELIKDIQAVCSQDEPSGAVVGFAAWMLILETSLDG